MVKLRVCSSFAYFVTVLFFFSFFLRLNNILVDSSAPSQSISTSTGPLGRCWSLTMTVYTANPSLHAPGGFAQGPDWGWEQDVLRYWRRLRHILPVQQESASTTPRLRNDTHAHTDFYTRVCFHSQAERLEKSSLLGLGESPKEAAVGNTHDSMTVTININGLTYKSKLIPPFIFHPFFFPPSFHVSARDEVWGIFFFSLFFTKHGFIWTVYEYQCYTLCVATENT